MTALTSPSLLRILLRRRDPKRAAVLARFFKTGPGEYGEGDCFLGITVPALRELARAHDEVPLPEVARLLRSPWHEARLLALLMLVRRFARGDARVRARVHSLYLRQTRYINNWDLVDLSAPAIVGGFEECRDRMRLRALARSPSVWERRIAMLATQYAIRQRRFGPALDIATRLVGDPHDLIHKAVGWMLREIATRDRAAAEAFLQRHAAAMPRTMLRYAIEHFPDARRRMYMRARIRARAGV